GIDLVMHRMTAAVGWMAQRNDLHLESGTFKPEQLLSNESFRQARIALEDDDDFFRHWRASVGTLDEGESRMRAPVEQLGNLLGNPIETVERQSGYGARRRRAAGQRDQRLGHAVGIGRLLGHEHLDNAKLGRAPGADELFLARLDARHDESRLVKREDLTERIIAAHADNPARACDQVLK